ncbi:hypothetical protein LSTR_LSTR008336 [Laodelphax striatellus]|uniref:Uncharacterized protein n=1 Tax=Laodelphax striatellus TaxID=195883 RepID=A0A482XKG8_LAOST|nr:hypothetical protein LSTR_LSTR008336 [Laodelphax striatellus]
MFLQRLFHLIENTHISYNIKHYSHLLRSTYSNSYKVKMGEEPRRKKPFAKPVEKIGTHNGVFHCDEVVGCYLLKLLFPSARIIRSRDDKVLKNCDIVIDVGGVYDPSTHRYDHHQRDFNHSISTVLKGKPWKTKLSSAGLVYCHFGIDIIRTILGDKCEEDLLDPIFDKVYEGLIQEIDGVDNGVPMFEGEPRYHITTGLSSRVKNLNSNWNQKDFDEELAFKKAMELAGSEFEDRVLYFSNVWWPARKFVLLAIKNRHIIDEGGEIMELSQSVPWKEHYFSLENQLDIEPTIKYVIFPSDGVWRVQAVSVTEKSFVLRTPLHEKWRGLRDQQLSDISGIDGCIFAHGTGFIGGNKTREGAIEMARKSIENFKKELSEK